MWLITQQERACKLKPWKVEISGDRLRSFKESLTPGARRTSCNKRNSKYFPDSPAEDHEQELLEIASLRVLLNKSVYEFDIVVSRRRKAYKWQLILNTRLRNHLANGPFRKCTRSLVVKHLMVELELRQMTTPLNVTYEATQSIYSYCYLDSGEVSFSKQHSIQQQFIKGIKCQTLSREISELGLRLRKTRMLNLRIRMLRHLILESSVAVDGQLQNDKETIPEVLPEVMVSTVDVTDSVKILENSKILHDRSHVTWRKLNPISIMKLLQVGIGAKATLSPLAHTSTSDQTLKDQDSSSDSAQNIVCMFRKANKFDKKQFYTGESETGRTDKI
ncbi:hypothetical protein GLOIN_2v1867626 [Rhizophagus clarus]|uniref:Uncharacterized protein n=1 Tax=Rhizophagus clarus TaxID=94130 RepID=A0A8H3LV42_9GLOM|nr:hypothetical protein GLOIN_2v1867626 [Rhizophagus clarus]